MLAITYLGEVIGELTFVSMSGQVWALPFLIYLNVIDTSGVNRWVLYSVITLLLMYPNRKLLYTCIQIYCARYLKLTGLQLTPFK